MLLTDWKFMPLMRWFVLMLGCWASACALAADPACDGPGLCEPDLGGWDTWRYVFNNQPGAAKATEAEAIDDASAMLLKTYPCGLSYTTVIAPYIESAKILDWTAKEDAARMPFVGFTSGANGNCRASTPESLGTIIIRRERRVRCPKGYGWLIRDNMPTVCIKD